MASESEQWKEIVDLKVTCPRILCIVPAVVQDVLASALMAIGARPIFPEDPGDISHSLPHIMAIMLDTGARLELIDSLCKSLGVDSPPLILSVSKVASSPKRSTLATTIVQKLEPTVIYGLVADVVALSKLVCVDDRDKDPSTKTHKPALLKNGRGESVSLSASLPARFRSRSPSPARLKDKLEQRQVCRSPTPKLSQYQCREGSKINISSIEVTGYVRRLAARSHSVVVAHESGLISNGETEAEIGNITVGMENLHSMSEVGSGILSAVLALVVDLGHKITPIEVAHGVALFFSAFDVAATKKSSPGELRAMFMDTLFEMNEASLREMAKIDVRHV